MQPKRYTVECNGKFTTINAMSPGNAAVAVYPEAAPISCKEENGKTIVNGKYIVTEVR